MSSTFAVEAKCRSELPHIRTFSLRPEGANKFCGAFLEFWEGYIVSIDQISNYLIVNMRLPVYIIGLYICSVEMSFRKAR